MTEAFIETTEIVLQFLREQTEARYIAIWDAYGVLAFNLGFTVEDILRAYEAKNAENYERQRTGY